MFRIKAKNGNVIDIDDADHAKRALADGHDVFLVDPEKKGDKGTKWDPEAEAGEATADGDSE